MDEPQNPIEIFELTPHTTDEYFESVIDLLSEQMKFIGKDCTREEIHGAVKNAIRPETRAHFFTAENSDGDVIGICLVNVCSGIEACGDYVWVNEIHTRSDRRTEGIGQALLQHIVKWAESNNCSHVNAVTSPTNKAAQNLCRSVGFHITNVAWLDKPLT